ncbi:MAG: sigma-70 family RNA polymerase sigma factor [Planctomycetes bacterium]|nr:sigma-70 family RNA polymerase sigma factor [Planctomycetota bacterium]
MGAGDISSGEWQTLLVEQVRARSQLLYRLAYRILRSPEKAQDVCQQALLKALRMQPSIREPRALPGWLTRVVITESLAVRRREQCEQKGRGAVVARQGERSPAADEAELRGLLYGALAELSQPAQAIVVLRLVQGMSGNEVAGLLGLHPSEVSRRLHASLDALRERLAPVYAGDR